MSKPNQKTRPLPLAKVLDDADGQALLRKTQNLVNALCEEPFDFEFGDLGHNSKATYDKFKDLRAEITRRAMVHARNVQSKPPDLPEK